MIHNQLYVRILFQTNVQGSAWSAVALTLQLLILIVRHSADRCCVLLLVTGALSQPAHPDIWQQRLVALPSSQEQYCVQCGVDGIARMA
jgi:hypothetical protein